MFNKSRIENLCNKGNTLFDVQNFKEARKNYQKAFDLLPMPKVEEKEFVWLVTAIADCSFFLEEYENSLKYLLLAIEKQESYRNPFITMRLGQVNYKLGKFNEAMRFMRMAIKLDSNMFEDEDHDYIDFLNSNQAEKRSVKSNFMLTDDDIIYEQKFNKLQYLWKDKDWDNLYINYVELYKLIPVHLIKNQLYYFIIQGILISCIKLGKNIEAKEWVVKLECSATDLDIESGIIDVWNGIVHYINNEEKDAYTALKKAVKKFGKISVLKDFYHFENEYFTVYKELEKKYN